VIALCLLLAGCTDFAIAKWGVDLCIAIAPPSATEAEVAAVTKRCGEGK